MGVGGFLGLILCTFWYFHSRKVFEVLFLVASQRSQL